MTTRDELIARLRDQPEPQVVRIEEFLDGNDDLGSIGCNLVEHPGLDAFRAVFARLAARRDVEAIYAQISELDPGEDCWPFADLVFVVGTIPLRTLAAEFAPLQPDEVLPHPQDEIPPALSHHAGKPIHYAWWD
jgi:hypothetical protein